jgi:chromate transporter
MTFIDGVIAAAMGAIAGSIITLGEKSITDPQTVGIAVAAFLFAHFLKVPSVVIVICAGILGLLLFH